MTWGELKLVRTSGRSRGICKFLTCRSHSSVVSTIFKISTAWLFHQVLKYDGLATHSTWWDWTSTLLTTPHLPCKYVAHSKWQLMRAEISPPVTNDALWHVEQIQTDIVLENGGRNLRFGHRALWKDWCVSESALLSQIPLLFDMIVHGRKVTS